ncbi:type IV pilus twitching motility protein PilT [Candidatus Dojkabacteria bacterium]|nr:type IV pilus twitching motility protein PilT [Candidatus Dojkabacteria bacterium]
MEINEETGTPSEEEVLAQSIDPNTATIERYFDLVLLKNASDLHFGVGYPVFMRVDGTLDKVGTAILEGKHIERFISSILTEDQKKTLKETKEVDLSYEYGENARFRINVYHEKGNMAAAFRFLPSKIRTIQELKLPQIANEFIEIPQGFVLVTGPTGSGKSTTIAAMVQEINSKQRKHIISIEDPIEYVYPKGASLVDQREMHKDTLSWDNALRAVLRQDPNVVVVGEMRDFETIAAAITVAETGHLVFATLHTNTAVQTIDRIIDVFPQHQQAQIRSQLSNVISAVISQRLIPVKSGGRRAVTEIMIGTPAVRNAIREGKTYQIDNIIQTSFDVGMVTLERSLVDLIREGEISVEDAQKHTTRPEELVRLMKKA